MPSADTPLPSLVYAHFRRVRVRARAAAAAFTSALCLCMSLAATAAPFVVTSTADSGSGSLRNAITQANALPGQPVSASITFNIDATTDPGCDTTSKVCTIALTSGDLPAMLGFYTVNGYSQPESAQNTNTLIQGDNAAIKIVLDGSGSAGSNVGLSGKDAIVSGLSIVGFKTGIVDAASQGNFIGLLPDGTTLKANSVAGILITSNTLGVTIGVDVAFIDQTLGNRNVIAGSPIGIDLQDLGEDQVAGNLIGTDATGLLARPNGDGIYIESTASRIDAIDLNLVSGNTGTGIRVNGIRHNLESNRVGTTMGGDAALGNGFGVTFETASFCVLDTLTGFSSMPSLVSGNLHDGVTFGVATTQTTMNVSGVGIDINWNALGNGGNGVVMQGSLNDVGNPYSALNVIAYNGGNGVSFPSATAANNLISEYQIHDNGALGISLNPGHGPTANDAMDTDTGADGLQNYPVITSAVAAGTSGSVTISGTFNSTPNETFVVELFGNAACDPSGFGQGAVFLGSAFPVATDASGNATWSTEVIVGSPVAGLAPLSPATAVYAATAWVASTTSDANNTSEFSQCFTPATAGSAGTLQFSSAAYSVGEAAGVATITVSRTGGSSGAVGVTAATVVGGTASAGTDYTSTTATLSWPDGDTASKSFTIPINDATRFAGTRTIDLALSSPTGGASLGTQATAVLTITGAGSPGNPGSLQFSSPAYSVGEGGGAATIVVTRSGGSSGAVTVIAATVAGGTATAGADYTATTLTLSWADGDAASKTFTIPVFDDVPAAGSKTVDLALSSASGGATLGTQAESVLTIIDKAQGRGGATTGAVPVPATSGCGLAFLMLLVGVTGFVLARRSRAG